ncbi:hypothetical protein DRO69_08570 [Candidatus Bathyarchaeota archaeon]|nr:MAG: hypothetical protein DRO69_08570 [Candidatus Bathyarchaeota archaeon]
MRPNKRTQQHTRSNKLLQKQEEQDEIEQNTVNARSYYLSAKKITFLTIKMENHFPISLYVFFHVSIYQKTVLWLSAFGVPTTISNE